MCPCPVARDFDPRKLGAIVDGRRKLGARPAVGRRLTIRGLRARREPLVRQALGRPIGAPWGRRSLGRDHGQAH
eukprot:2539474-Heterocapsa_arctica.AAC.1